MNEKQNKSYKPRAHKPSPLGSKKIVPVYLYITECCKALSKKAPCVRKAEDRKENKKSLCPLGSFRCTTCGKPAKVRRQRNTENETVSV